MVFLMGFTLFMSHQVQTKNSQRTAKEQPKNTELPIAVPAVSYGT
jgi:hypothetical protein